jgi:hypothetical protein
MELLAQRRARHQRLAVVAALRLTHGHGILPGYGSTEQTDNTRFHDRLSRKLFPSVCMVAAMAGGNSRFHRRSRKLLPNVSGCGC